MSESLRFRKMHGLGNDFMIVDATVASVDLDAERIRSLADRHRGVGFDQLLVLEPGNSDTFGFRIFNADGSPAEQCGNGMRCLARYVFERGYGRGDAVRFAHGATAIEARINPDGTVAVDMGQPELEPARIPFQADACANSYPLTVNGLDLTVGAVSMGNPHALLRVESTAAAPVAELGPAIETHPAFPRRANVGFVQVLSPEHISLRVWERGTGETLACGTGACAAVVWGRLMQWLAPEVAVDLPGGTLAIRWPGENETVWMSGPAQAVYEGELLEH